MDISEVTRRGIFDAMSVARLSWSGRFDEPPFLARIFDLSCPDLAISTEDCMQDIWQHRVNNNDGDDDWVLFDKRIRLLDCPDENFLLFLCETLHPVVYDTVLRSTGSSRFSTTVCGSTGGSCIRIPPYPADPYSPRGDCLMRTLL